MSSNRLLLLIFLLCSVPRTIKAQEAEVAELQESAAAIDRAEAIEEEADETPEKNEARELSKQLLKHGKRQVRLMLGDRPGMAAYETDKGFKLVVPSDPFYEWAARKFAGEDTHEPVFWDPSEPTAATAEHIYSSNYGPGRIRVSGYMPVETSSEQSRRRLKDFELLWSQAIFELNNISGHAEFRRLSQAAIDGEIERDEYIMSNARNEYRAKQLSLEVYRDIWVPWAKKKKLKPSLLYGYRAWAIPPDFDSWIGRYVNRKSYPWVPYGNYFDIQRKYGEATSGTKESNEGSKKYWRGIEKKLSKQSKDVPTEPTIDE